MRRQCSDSEDSLLLSRFLREFVLDSSENRHRVKNVFFIFRKFPVRGSRVPISERRALIESQGRHTLMNEELPFVLIVRMMLPILS